ncbi:Bax inhibitor-1/YccA family protein [Homoserinibacter sp. YIM 151385]|uniref:Bax inhibitor-1/YccA family protein n=1 Tax=Homoserinibacter sp. YIM 151385 TaxID=2985506 RepID=UPI0022F08263|nr:Bax inhibitor-1/YccA family protein [Homoserinibacter sp. YIM 151385]WBU37736.1 Bax inhibitor-1/YccA family protein [Homoserinibacter sp. YIM 151385]
MASSNPAFANPAFSQNGVPPVPRAADVSAEQLSAQYGRPSAQPDEMGRMTYEDTIVKTVLSFGVLLIGAVIGWMFPVLALPGAIIGFVLALVNIFKKQPSPALVLAYAGFEGLFVGGISGIFAKMWDGIVPMAVFGTLGVVGVTLALFASGKVRASKRATKIFLVAMVGYAAFSLVNMGLMLFGVTDSMFGLRDVTFLGIPLGVILGVVVVILAAYSLVLDFDSIQQGVRNGAPRVFAWRGAFGIMVTVVWLYLEILRLLTYFLPRN